MKKGILFLLTLFLFGCKSIGPNQIYLDRTRYNDVVADTTDEELLKNLVRIRYMRQVSMLEITNIIASYTFNPSVNGTASFIRKPVTNSASPIPFIEYVHNFFGALNPGARYSDQPTITYMPVEDSEFIRELLVPIETHFLALMVSGGMHDPHLLFNLTLKQINEDISEYNGPELNIFAEERYKKFHRIADLLDQLTATKGVRLVPIRVDGYKTIAIHFARKAIHAKEATEIKTLLHIPQQYQDIILMYKRLPYPNLAVIQTRSVLGSMIFLSNGVHTPKVHHGQIVRPYITVNAQRHGWNPLMNKIIQIHVARHRPSNAYLAVSLYDHWYYIQRGDVRSIASFNYQRVLHVLTRKRELEYLGINVKANVTPDLARKTSS